MMRETSAVIRRIRAPRAAIYGALLDPQAIQAWRVPHGMRCVVHEFDPREGGRFRVSLSYDDPAAAGKSDAHTDTYHGRFVRLVPETEVAEVLEFETEDPMLQGEMLVTTTLTDADEATDVTIAYENVPVGMPAADNQVGTQMALSKLAALVEQEDGAETRAAD